jgi:hypothetical protein
MIDQKEDARRHPRFRYRCHAKLSATGQSWEAHLVNLSQQGALVAILEPHIIKTDDHIELLITLSDESGETLEMAGKVAHVKEHYIGLDGKAKTENDFAKLNLKIKELSGQAT